MKNMRTSLLAVLAAASLSTMALAQSGTSGTSGTTGGSSTGTTTITPQPGANTQGSGQTTTGTSQQQQTGQTATGGSAAGSAANVTAQQGQLQGMLASKLIGMSVYSTNGESIGEINDIVVQPQSGQANAAIIGVGGFLGIGEKDVAIDIAQLKMIPSNDASGGMRLTLETTKEALNSAPSFDRKQLQGEGTATGSTTNQMQQQNQQNQQ